MEPITTTRNTTAIRNILLNRGLMIRHMAKLKIRFSGARTATRIIIINAFLHVGDIGGHTGHQTGER